MSCFFARHVPGLSARGWPIIPVAGKRPIIKGWQRFNHEMPGEDQVAEWCRRYPDANVGLAVGPASGVVAVDVDVTDPDAVAEVAKIADENFGPTPAVRIGRAPKFVRIYRGQGIKSRKAHPIEIFGDSGQVVILGIHPETGQPYSWVDRSPLDLRPQDLPVITEAQVDRFLATAAEVVPVQTMAGRVRRSGHRAPDGIFAGLRAERRGKRGRPLVRTLQRQLARARRGELHNTMISVVGFMVHRGYSDQAIRGFFDEHFSASRQGQYAAAWEQIDTAIAGARRRFDHVEPTTVRLARPTRTE